MSDTLKIVPLKAGNLTDIPAALRLIADEIEAGEYGDAHNLAWAIDCGHNRVDCGLLGQAPEPGSTAYFLFGRAMKKLIDA